MKSWPTSSVFLIEHPNVSAGFCDKELVRCNSSQKAITGLMTGFVIFYPELT